MITVALKDRTLNATSRMPPLAVTAEGNWVGPIFFRIQNEELKQDIFHLKFKPNITSAI